MHVLVWHLLRVYTKQLRVGGVWREHLGLQDLGADVRLVFKHQPRGKRERSFTLFWNFVVLLLGHITHDVQNPIFCFLLNRDTPP